MTYAAGMVRWCPRCAQSVNASNYARHLKKCVAVARTPARGPVSMVVTYDGLELVWDPHFGDALAHALRQPSPLVDDREEHDEQI